MKNNDNKNKQLWRFLGLCMGLTSMTCGLGTLFGLLDQGRAPVVGIVTGLLAVGFSFKGKASNGDSRAAS